MSFFWLPSIKELAGCLLTLRLDKRLWSRVCMLWLIRFDLVAYTLSRTSSDEGDLYLFSWILSIGTRLVESRWLLSGRTSTSAVGFVAAPPESRAKIFSRSMLPMDREYRPLEMMTESCEREFWASMPS